MGKSNKPAKWFNAVKKAFRSPSKEKHGHRHSKAITDEKLGPASSCNICTQSATHTVPTPLPLPSFEIITFDEAEHSDTQKQPLPTPEAISLTNSVQSLNEEEHMEEEIRHYNDEEEEEEDVVEEEELEKKKFHNHEDEIRRDDVIEEVDEEAFSDEEDEDEEEIVANGTELAHGEDNHRINYVSEEEESEAAATRIQQRFEGPLALGGLIRLQALVRGHQVRRQAAKTLRAMQALVRVQAHVRGHQFRRSKEGQAIQESIKLHQQLRSSGPSFKAGDGHWDTSRGSVEDRDAERSRWEIGARKTERAKAYAFSQQLKKKNTPSKNSLYINCEPDQQHWGWTWLERWTSARPWELTHQQQQPFANSRKDYNYYEIVPTSPQKNLGYTTGKKEIDVSTWKESYFGTSSPITSPHDINTPTKATTTKSIFNSPRALSLNLSPQAVLEKRGSGNFSMSPVGTTTNNNSGNFPSSPVGSRAKSISPRAKNISISPRALSQSPREKSPRKDSHFHVSHFEQHHHPLPLPLPVPVESAASNNNISTSPKSGNNNFALFKPSPIEVPTQYPGWGEEEEKVIHDEEQEPAAKTVFESPEALPNLAAKPSSEKLLSSNFSVASSSSPAHSSDDSLPLAPPSPQASDTSLPVPETPPERFLSEDHDLSATMDHLMLPESAALRKPRKSPAANGVVRRHIKVDSPTSHKQSASDSTSAHTSNGHREHRNGMKTGDQFNGDNNSPLPTGVMTTKPTKARYMAPTESAKAKYRSSSNPKTRSANLVESPTGKQPKRFSLGGQQAKIDHSPRTDHSPKTALNTQHQQRNSAFQTRGVLSPKVAHLREKSPDIGAVDSPARRNSLGGTTGADGIYGRWRT